jgi:hypothetical protein
MKLTIVISFLFPSLSRLSENSSSTSSSTTVTGSTTLSSEPLYHPHPHYTSSLSDTVNNNTTTTTTNSVTDTLLYNNPTPRQLPSSGNANITRAGKVEDDLLENSILSEFDLVASISNKVADAAASSSCPVSASDANKITSAGNRTGSGLPPSLLGVSSSSSSVLLPTSSLSSYPSSSSQAQSEHLHQALVHSQSVNHFSNSNVPCDAYLSCVRPDMLKNTNIPMGRQAPISAPNTPESLRRQHLQNSMMMARGGGGGGGRGGVSMEPPTIMTTSLQHTPADKREKMEYNQMMRSLSEREGRPLSYHGRSGSVCYEHLPQGTTTTTNTTGGGGGVVSKRHIMSSGTRSRKESVLLNRRSMPGPYLENRYRDKFGTHCYTHFIYDFLYFLA